MIDVRNAVRAFILENFLVGEDPRNLTDQTELRESGILDWLLHPPVGCVPREDIQCRARGRRPYAGQPVDHRIDRYSPARKGCAMNARPSEGLAGYLAASARARAEAVAVTVPNDAAISYGELDALANRLRDRLWALGVRPGDRVGFRLPKSIDSLATIFGILKCGAAYVPVDAESPAARGAFILNDCAVSTLINRLLKPSLPCLPIFLTHNAMLHAKPVKLPGWKSCV